MNIVASWRSDAKKFYKNTDPQKVYEEISTLGENPQTEEVLELAKNENSEMHPLFEWDDAKAAHQHRLEQARRIMQDLQIVEVGLNKKQSETIEVPVRMYYSLKGESGYRPTPLIFQDETLHTKLLMTAYGELNAFTKKYSILSELEPVFKAIRELPIHVA